MGIASLAIKSFRNRKFTTGLAIASITLSVALLLAVEILRVEARNSFSSTISGTDLIVGARTSSTHLLLYSVFGVGNPSDNLSWASYREWSGHPQVEWSIPVSMGDSHRGFRVVGTDRNFFAHYRYARERRLRLDRGAWFEQADEAVLGAEAAADLGYRPGDEIVVAHGSGDVSFVEHRDDPYRVSGILERTGTPVDRTILISLDGFDGMHDDWRFGGAGHERDENRVAGAGHDHAGEDPGDDDHAGREISAFLLGLKSRGAALFMQRAINEFDGEPLSAILPGFTLLELWQIVGLVEKTLRAIALLVVVVGLTSMLIILMSSLNERRREMAILRAVGARPAYLFLLILGEALFVTLSGIVLGALLISASILAARDWVAREFGLFLPYNWVSTDLLLIVTLVAVCGCLVGIIPGLRIYRYSLSDGMTIRT